MIWYRVGSMALLQWDQQGHLWSHHKAPLSFEAQPWNYLNIFELHNIYRRKQPNTIQKEEVEVMNLASLITRSSLRSRKVSLLTTRYDLQNSTTSCSWWIFHAWNSKLVHMHYCFMHCNRTSILSISLFLLFTLLLNTIMTLVVRFHLSTLIFCQYWQSKKKSNASGFDYQLCNS